MKKQINLRFVYSVNHLVMNVGNDGTKVFKDPVFGVYYVYGSSANIKHNVKDFFKDYSGINSPKSFFEKDFDPSNMKEDGSISEKQGGVGIEMDFSNPFIALFGGWNATAVKGVEKYTKAAIKSSVQFSPLVPIHPFMSYKKSECGVNIGDENSKVVPVFKNKRYDSVEELAKDSKVSTEDILNWYKNTRAMNFIPKLNEETNGIYKHDICINVDDACRYNLTDNPDAITDDEVQELIKNGMILKEIRNKKYLYFPKDFAKKYLTQLVYSLFYWEFTSNNSLHGAKPELLRVAITDKDVITWNNSTFASVSEDDDKKAELQFTDNLEEYGVYTFNMLCLKKYLNINNADINANKAIEKTIELVNKFVDEL